MNLKHSDRRLHIHHKHSIPDAAIGRIPIAKRRSSRMALSASVAVSGEDRRKATFSATARATNLNRHGAAVQLNRELQVGSVVMLKNQRGVQVSARIVSQLRALQESCTYAIEFVEQNEAAKDFWGISFPTTA